jgi:L-ascorbate metabolism protein UlaG (beta-lactamase superfamily)
VITPLGNDALMREADPAIRAEAHDWGDRVALNDDVAVHLEPCLHWSARGVTDRRKALWAAFVIEAPGGPIYHIGDTGFGDGALFPRMKEKHGAFRLAHIPIGAYEPRWFMKDQHVNPDEAARIFRAVGAAHAIGHHWGTFRLTAEGIEQPPEALDLALTKHGIAAERFRAFRPGEAWDVPPLSAFA